MGIGDQPAQRGFQAATDLAGERQQDQRRTGDNELGVDLLALGDVATFQRIVEFFLGRVFCAFGFGVSLALA